MGWLGFLIGGGYVFYMWGTVASTTKHKSYNTLFNSKTYLNHLAFSVALSGFGLYRCLTIDHRSTWFSAPTIFLIAFFVSDKVVCCLTGRHIIMASRYDYKPPHYRWYIDAPFSILIVSAALVIPGMLMSYFRPY